MHVAACSAALGTRLKFNIYRNLSRNSSLQDKSQSVIFFATTCEAMVLRLSERRDIKARL